LSAKCTKTKEDSWQSSNRSTPNWWLALQLEVWIAEEHTIEPHLETIAVKSIAIEAGHLMAFGSHDNRPITIDLLTMEVFWLVPDNED